MGKFRVLNNVAESESEYFSPENQPFQTTSLSMERG